MCFVLLEENAALEQLLALGGMGSRTGQLGASLEHHCLIPQRRRDLLVPTAFLRAFFALPIKCTTLGPIQQSITIFLNLFKKKTKGVTPCSEQPSSLQLCKKTPWSSLLLIPAWRQSIWRGRSGTLGAAGLCAGCWQGPPLPPCPG